MATAKILDLSGTAVGEIELPSAFYEDYRPDLIKKAVLSAQANRRHPYGTTLYAGMQTSATGWGSGRGASHIPRIVNGSRAARVPHAKGGRRAHPPKPAKDYTEKMNKKERQMAVRSAIAATCNEDLVITRGHIFMTEELPIIADNAFEDLSKTRDVIAFFENIGVYEDVIRAKLGRNIRAGRGKMRGRKYKNRKSVLVVTGDAEPGTVTMISLAARNLSGVDVTDVSNLNTELLAPGTHAGRLTVWTKSAIVQLAKKEGVFE